MAGLNRFAGAYVGSQVIFDEFSNSSKTRPLPNMERTGRILLD